MPKVAPSLTCVQQADMAEGAWTQDTTVSVRRPIYTSSPPNDR
jgi:hypothetical protein